MSQPSPQAAGAGAADAGAAAGAPLSPDMLARIQRNKRRAELLRSTRAALKTAKQIVAKQAEETSREPLKRKASSGYRRDTEAGFFLPLPEEEKRDEGAAAQPEAREPLLSELGPDKTCQDCGTTFLISTIWKTFSLPVCNACRDLNREGRYRLVTKTEASQEYLLKEGDLRKGYKDALPYLEKANPHNDTWGRMKLYLLCQVEERSFSHYGDEKGLDKEIVRRIEAKRKMKQQRHIKSMKKLRVDTMTSIWRQQSKKHEHEFDPAKETYDEEEDEWVKVCTTCGFEVRFEKM